MIMGMPLKVTSVHMPYAVHRFHMKTSRNNCGVQPERKWANLFCHHKSLKDGTCSRFFSRTTVLMQHDDDMFKDDPEMQSLLKEIASDFEAEKRKPEGSSSSESDSDSSSSSDSDSDTEVKVKDEHKWDTKLSKGYSSHSSDSSVFEDNNLSELDIDGIKFEESVNDDRDSTDTAMTTERCDDIQIEQQANSDVVTQATNTDSEIVYEEYGFDFDEIIDDDHETVIEEQPLPISLSRKLLSISELHCCLYPYLIFNVSHMYVDS